MIEVRGLGLVDNTLTTDTVVIRGDVMVAVNLTARAMKDFARLHYYGLSVMAILRPLVTVGQTVAYTGLSFPMVQLSTVARVRAAGFGIERTFSWPHCTIDIGADPSESVMLRLIDAFDPPEPIPEMRFVET
jgi:hypothetical protein